MAFRRSDIKAVRKFQARDLCFGCFALLYYITANLVPHTVVYIYSNEYSYYLAQSNLTQLYDGCMLY